MHDFAISRSVYLCWKLLSLLFASLVLTKLRWADDPNNLLPSISQSILIQGIDHMISSACVPLQLSSKGEQFLER